ncbi:putative leader peptide [Actinomycetospora sp. CA-101289]
MATTISAPGRGGSAVHDPGLSRRRHVDLQRVTSAICPR